MTSNKDGTNKTLENEVSKEPLGKVHDFRSAEEIERERRKKEGGGFFKGISSLVDGVLGTKEDKQAQIAREQNEKMNERRKLKYLLADTYDNIFYSFDEESNKYKTEIDAICKKIKNASNIPEETYNFFNKVTNVIFVKPGIIDAEARQKWQKIIQGITNAGIITQKEKNDLFWTGRLLQIYHTIKEKVERDTDYLHNQIKIPKEKLNNLISEEIYKSIEENFSFGEANDRGAIPKEELLEKGKTTIVTAIKNIRETFAELLTKRLPGDYLEHKEKLNTDSASKMAIQWGYVYYGSTSLGGQRDSEKSKEGFISDRGPGTRIENSFKYAYIFLSPNQARRLLNESVKMSLFKGILDKNSMNSLSDYDKGGNILKVVEFVDANIESLFLHGIPSNILSYGKTGERFSETCSNLIYNYQRLKCELMSGDSVLETLGKIVTIYEKNDWDNEIENIFGIFERVRHQDIVKIREIIKDYREIIQPKMVKMDGKDGINSLTFSELIKIRASEDTHKKYKGLVIDKIKPITFIGEVGNRLRWSSYNTTPEPSNPEYDIILSRIKKKATKDGVEIINGEVIKTAISPNKKNLVMLVSESGKNKANHSLHVIDIKKGFIERSYSGISIKGNHAAAELYFLANEDDGVEYNIYLSDESNFYLFGGLNEDGTDNKKLFNTSDAAISGNRDRGIDITEGREVKISKIDRSGEFLLRFHHTYLKASETIGSTIGQSGHYKKLNTEGLTKQTEARTYVSILGLADSHVLLKGEIKTHEFPTQMPQDYLLPFLQQDNSFYLSKSGKYFVTLFESMKNGSKMYIYEITKDGAIELISKDVNYADIGMGNKIRQIEFTQDEKKIFILHDEGDITLYNISANKVMIKLSAAQIKRAITKNLDAKIFKISLDPTGEYLAIYAYDDGKYNISFLSLSNGKIKLLNIEEQIRMEKSSHESCNISTLSNNLKLSYNPNGSIFKLDFKGTINKEIDISGIFDKIISYKRENDMAKRGGSMVRPSPSEIIFSEKIGNSVLEIVLNKITKTFVVTLGMKNFGTYNLKTIINEILQTKANTGDNSSYLSHFKFSDDGQELLLGTHDGKYGIIGKRVINSLFSSDSQEQQTS